MRNVEKTDAPSLLLRAAGSMSALGGAAPMLQEVQSLHEAWSRVVVHEDDVAVLADDFATVMYSA